MKYAVSSSGRLYLLGEHAILDGYPALILSLEKGVSVYVEEIKEKYLLLNIGSRIYKISNVDDINIIKNISIYTWAVLNHYFKDKVLYGLRINVKSDLPFKGLGTHSSLLVSLIAAIETFLKQNYQLNKEEILERCYEITKSIGKDVDVLPYSLTAAIYGRLIYLKNKGDTVKIDLKFDNYTIYIINVGAKFNVPMIIDSIINLKKEFPGLYKKLISIMDQQVDEAVKALLRKDFNKLAEIVNIYHGLLKSLGFLNEEIEKILYVSINNGALAAKISGVSGDNIIAIVKKEHEETFIKAVKNKVKKHYLKVKPGSGLKIVV